MITLLACLSLCSSQLAYVSAQVATQETEENQTEEVETMQTPEGTYQLELNYPINIEEDSFDDSFITNQLNRFTAYQGQGYVWLKSEDLQNFQLFINGQRVEGLDYGKTDWQQVDISKLTVNGENSIQMTQTDASDQMLEVKIPYPVLEDHTDEWAEHDNFQLIDQIIQAEIDHGFTSAQLVVTYNGQIIKQAAYGLANSYSPDGEKLTEGTQVDQDTLYDLASNTKMYATNYALQKLVTDGEIELDQKVSEYLPDFQDDPRDAIKGKTDLTVRELLEHQAGFPADPQYHNNNYDPNAEDDFGENANRLYTQDREEILQKIINTPLAYTPGTQTIYSDVDYMLLGLLIEEVTGQALDTYVAENFYQPLGLSHTTFNPLEHGFSKNDIAATELNGNTRDGSIDFDNIRTETIQGEVHDEKAYYTMDGVSGHAGLFSNATDLATLTQVMLNGGGYGEEVFFSPDVIDEFTKPKASDSTYGLGWRRQGDNGYAWAFSPLVSSSTVGHTGWTGTLTVIDPENHFSLVLLTNTKNSPVIDNEANPNDFVGDHFLTGGYGLIASLAADAIHHESSEANDAKLIDMFIQNYQLLTEQTELVDVDQAAFEALNDVLNQRKDRSTLIRNFIEPTVYQEIEAYLNQ